MSTTWTYNGHSFELDLDSMSGLERYDAAIKAQNAKLSELSAGVSGAREVLVYCDAVTALLDTLFGEDTTDYLLEGSARPSDYDALYESLQDFVHEQTAAAAERRKKILNKYKPEPNREQRRALEQAVKQIAKSTDNGAAASAT